MQRLGISKQRDPRAIRRSETLNRPQNQDSRSTTNEGGSLSSTTI